MLAMQTGVEEFAVSAEEMDTFTKAAGNVARHYNVETTQKTLDWVAFVGVSAHVFGTRAVAIAIKSRRTKEPKQRRGPAEVRHLRPVEQPSADMAQVILNPQTHDE